MFHKVTEEDNGLFLRICNVHVCLITMQKKIIWSNYLLMGHSDLQNPGKQKLMLFLSLMIIKI